jgi:di/tricarboxylate transporter
LFDQIFLFGLFVVVFGLLIWGRFRYDLVAFTALVVAVMVGVVPRADAFAGFATRRRSSSQSFL